MTHYRITISKCDIVRCFAKLTNFQLSGSVEIIKGSTSLVTQFYLGSGTLGTCHGGCCVQTVWLPVARSQKARFASRKRIKVFQCGIARHHREGGNNFETTFDLHSGHHVSSCTTCGINVNRSRSHLSGVTFVTL